MILFDSIDYPSSCEINRRYEGLDKAAYFSVSSLIIKEKKEALLDAA